MAQQPQHHYCYRAYHQLKSKVDRLRDRIGALETQLQNNPGKAALRNKNNRLINQVQPTIRQQRSSNLRFNREIARHDGKIANLNGRFAKQNIEVTNQNIKIVDIKFQLNQLREQFGAQSTICRIYTKHLDDCKDCFRKYVNLFNSAYSDL